MVYDKDFLLKLDKVKNKIIHARITALTFDEKPIEYIEGRVTQGSINVDGASAVRRTCSLTIVADNFNSLNYYWGINTKFKLEVGVENFIDPQYPNIIWFKQGIYLFTSFNSSRSASNFTISIQGKDKMSLLNGEIGGSLESCVDFGRIEEESSEDVWTIKEIPLRDIIRNAVHVYAGEPYRNIIINDLEDYGLELLEYRYDIPMYLYRTIDSNIFNNIVMNGKLKCEIVRDNKRIPTTLEELLPTELDMLVDPLTGTSNPSEVFIEGTPYYVAKIEYGQTAGYRLTDLTYAGDLIANVGESITTVLDKIKNMLSEFEYFYDLDGQFIFQRKKSFINTLWTPILEGEFEDIDEDGNSIYYSEKYIQSMANASSWSYVFSGAELITAFNNNPNLLNMRNDYSIWGNRKSVSGQEIPVHLRYAIDIKPEFYKNMDGQIFVTSEEIFEKLKQNAKEKILNNVNDRIQNFNLHHEVPDTLNSPIKKEDGSWTTGWWDIRDWHDYYYALTLEEPRFTMKWYSKNDENGCIPCNTIPGYEKNTSWTWMIVQTLKEDGTYSLSFGHGSGGEPLKSSESKSIKYESFYDETGKLITQKVEPEETRMIRSPYKGCNDTHTYLYFLNNHVSENQRTYFYNPDFPDNLSFEEVVQNQIDKEFNEYLESGALNFVDWREIIYQMAIDYYKYNTLDDFELLIRNNNLDYYPEGKTGYERYYTDIQGFWRQLYNPLEEKEEFYPKGHKNQFWLKDVYEYPETLNFWFDFLDAEGELSQFNVKNVGARSKAVNETTVKSIYFRETPDIIFQSPNEEIQPMDGYKYIQVQDIDSMFSISAQGKSAKDRLDELIYQHGYCIESATITTIPIYYLEPNVRIHIYDQDTNINGDYIISKMTIPLAYNGTMQITATKAAESII